MNTTSVEESRCAKGCNYCGGEFGKGVLGKVLKGVDDVSEGFLMMDGVRHRRAAELDQFYRNILHTDLVAVLWQSAHIIPIRISDIDGHTGIVQLPSCASSGIISAFGESPSKFTHWTCGGCKCQETDRHAS